MFQNSRVLKGFVVLEGINAAGKSTQLELLDNWFRCRGVAAWATAEPTNGVYGAPLRRKKERDESPATEWSAMSYALDREEHLYNTGGAPWEGGIVELCLGGKWCLCDRYLFSSLAYQGGDSSFCEEKMAAAWRYNEGFPLPQLVIYLKLTPKELKSRMAKREDLSKWWEFLLAVQRNYDNLFSELQCVEAHHAVTGATRDTCKVLEVDAAAGRDEVHAQIVSAIWPLLN